ncbi:MAG TPA: DUF4870 domain-containing protein [Glaciihabitans sp.]|jgi:uncharacterized Tic20 family protein|nr:DUF4870 domain-containing protein [Glaciihabitans sp.]
MTNIAPTTSLNPTQDRMWAAFAHFGGVVWFIPALIIFLLFRRRGSLTEQESKEALNWQITYTIASATLVAIVLILGTFFALVGAIAIANVLGNLPFVLYAVNAFFSILGGIRVTEHGTYRYPFALRLIK